MRWLTSCPVKSISSGFRPSRWDAISRDAGVVGGTEQWDERLARYARRQEQAANGQSDDIPEAKLLRIKQTAREAWSLRAFMLRLHDDLKPPADGSSLAGLRGVDRQPDEPVHGHRLTPTDRARKPGDRRNEHPGVGESRRRGGRHDAGRFSRRARRGARRDCRARRRVRGRGVRWIGRERGRPPVRQGLSLGHGRGPRAPALPRRSPPARRRP